jgi:hypothetical protein
MKALELTKNVTTESLLTQFESRFGQTLNLEGMDQAQLEDMANMVESATTAVFYTIWSYAAGAGRELIQEAQRSIEQEFPGIETYVTLSPKTEMARKFHLKNGAGVYRENSDTVNYIYK